MLSSVATVVREVVRVGADRVRPSKNALPDTGPAFTPAVLERLCAQPAGSITAIRVLDETHGTAGRVTLAIESTEASTLPDTVFVKVTPKSVVQRLMMNLFDLGRREVLFYDAVSSDVPVRVPRCFGATIDAKRGRNVIVLEDLRDARFRDIREPASIAEAEVVIDALADLHAAFWDSPRLSGDLASVRARSVASQQLGNLFVSRTLAKPKGAAAALLSPELVAASVAVQRRREEIDAVWQLQSLTVCHGDTHFGNLFFEGDVPGFLDWQAFLVAPGIRDVAYFLIAGVEVEDLEANERRLVERYAIRLADHGVDVDVESLWTLYRAIAVEIYVAAVITAQTSDRMQPAEISIVGVKRVVAAVQRLDTFGVLTELLDNPRRV